MIFTILFVKYNLNYTSGWITIDNFKGLPVDGIEAQISTENNTAYQKDLNLTLSIRNISSSPMKFDSAAQWVIHLFYRENQNPYQEKIYGCADCIGDQWILEIVSPGEQWLTPISNLEMPSGIHYVDVDPGRYLIGASWAGKVYSKPIEIKILGKPNIKKKFFETLEKLGTTLNFMHAYYVNNRVLYWVVFLLFNLTLFVGIKRTQRGNPKIKQ